MKLRRTSKLAYPTIEFCSLDACYVTIKGRVFYIDMSLDEPVVSTWTEDGVLPDGPTDEETLMGGGGPND